MTQSLQGRLLEVLDPGTELRLGAAGSQRDPGRELQPRGAVSLGDGLRNTDPGLANPGVSDQALFIWLAC